MSLFVVFSGSAEGTSQHPFCSAPCVFYVPRRDREKPINHAGTIRVGLLALGLAALDCRGNFSERGIHLFDKIALLVKYFPGLPLHLPVILFLRN